MFERVVLINLERRPDRLAAFRRRQKDAGWPLPDPQVFAAVHGDTVGVPGYWVSGGGAWGCCRSHVAVLERAVMDDVASLLVLEDDATWTPEAWGQLDAFLRDVPRDWDQLMLGGQHIQSAATLAPGVQRCRNTQRTHAYAVRGKAMRSLLGLWYGCQRHIDHVMGPWQRDWRVYAPDPFVFGQAEGQSDIKGTREPLRYWSAGGGQASDAPPVLHLTAPKDAVRRLRGRGLHTGHDRDPDTDLDRGLSDLAASDRPLPGLRKWLDVVGWEAAAEGKVLAVWHPLVTPVMVREAHTGTVLEVKGETAEEVLRALPAGLIRPNYAHSHVVVFRGPREAMEELRGRGWHAGHWRDDVTGQDNGLRKVATLGGERRAARLRAWVDELARETEDVAGGVVCVWHPEVTADEVRAAAGGRAVVEVAADDADEAVRTFEAAANPQPVEVQK